ncbi:MAG: phosphatase PAP2 family protein [Chloroflexia bacterium]|nr:phosphatase PAP2 family protein [Chloroflexia bacterium]
MNVEVAAGAGARTTRTPSAVSGRSTFPHQYSRRALLGSALAASASLAFPTAALHAAASQSQSEVTPGLWRTWLLTSGDEVRPAKPAAPTPEELSELVELQGQRTASTLATIAPWDDPTAVLPWTNLTLDLIRVHTPNPVRAARALALLHVALYDTLVATADARSTYPHPAPMSDNAVVPLGSSVSGMSSFPSDHAAVAAAASTVLTYLFPKESAATFAALADQAATSQLLAARAFRSDIEAGQAIGRAVGERAVARGKVDRASTSWDGSGRLTDPGSWQPTPPGYFQQPAEPLAGTWRTWILSSGDQYRPPAPPAFRSPSWEAELAGVQEAVARRTPEQEAAVRFWAGGPGTVTPAGLWIEIARNLIVRDGLDPAHAARVLALTSVAMADAFICCWDAKYTYWTERPITADPELDVLIPTPPFPSYTSGHSTISTAAATVLGYLFPADEADLAARADEAKSSRLWAGIHFPIDNEMGALGGGMIGRLVVVRAREDGAN